MVYSDWAAPTVGAKAGGRGVDRSTEYRSHSEFSYYLYEYYNN